MSQTQVTYNGVTLFGCTTRQFEQEPMLDDSGTDLIGHRFRVRVTGYCHGLNVSQGDPLYANPHISPATGTFADDASDNHVAIRYNLLEPRKSFVMRVGSQNLLTATPHSASGLASANQTAAWADNDIDNGPKPTVFSITHVASNNIFRVDFGIEICKLRCENDSEPANRSLVLSNRWSVVDEIDRDMMTNRLWQGRLRLATGVVNPHSFRGYVVPILQAGFVRQTMRFVASNDGLALDYTILDKEVAFSAPPPATSWNFTYSITGSDALQVELECQVRLKGDRRTSKQQLIQLGMQILDAKIHISRRSVKPGDEENYFQVLGFSIVDVYGSDDNEIQIGMKVRLANTLMAMFDNPNNAALGAYRGIGVPISAQDIQGYDFNLSRGANVTPALQGPLPLTAAFHAYLQTACSSQHGYGVPSGELVPDVGYRGENQPAHRIQAYAVATSAFSGTQGDDYLTPDHVEHPYTYYRCHNQYENYQGKVQLPLAKSAASTSACAQDTSTVIQVCGVIAKRVVRVVAERCGDWPDLPQAPETFTDDNGIKYTLLDFTPLPDAPHRDMAGGRMYAISAQYVYAMSRPISDSDKYSVGSLPWDANAAEKKTFSSGDVFNT